MTGPSDHLAQPIIALGIADIVIGEHAVLDVIVTREVKRHAAADRAAVIVDVMCDAFDLSPLRSRRLLKEGADLCRGACDLFTVIVEAIGVDAVDKSSQRSRLVLVPIAPDRAKGTPSTIDAEALDHRGDGQRGECDVGKKRLERSHGCCCRDLMVANREVADDGRAENVTWQGPSYK